MFREDNLEFKSWLMLESQTVSSFIKEKFSKDEINKVIVFSYDSLPEEEKLALKKWILYQKTVRPGDIQTQTISQELHVLYGDKSIFKKFNNPNYTYKDLLRDNEEYHKRLKSQKDKEYHGKIRHLNPPLIINGLEWVSLDTAYSDEYGKSMGHCGNAAHRKGDNIYSLYDPKTDIHYVTCIVQDQALGESKGRNNDKPAKRFLPAMKAFLLARDQVQDIVMTIRGMGYKPENNFQFTDLNEQDQKEILKIKPNIDDFVSFRTMGKQAYVIEDDHLYVSKRLSNSEFKELANNEIYYKVNRGPSETAMVDLAGEYYRRKMNPPDRLAIPIIDSPEMSYMLCAYYLPGKKEARDYEEGIAKDNLYSAEYAGVVLKGKNIPKDIWTTIINNAKAAEYYAEVMKYKDLHADVIKAVSNNPECCCRYVKNAVKENNINIKQIPEQIMKGIVENKNFIRIPFKEIFEIVELSIESSDDDYVPDVITNYLGWREGGFTYNLIKKREKAGEYFPKSFLAKLETCPGYAWECVKHKEIDPKQSPVIINAIAKSSSSANQYAELLRYQNVPKEILASIVKLPHQALSYARNAGFIDNVYNPNPVNFHDPIKKEEFEIVIKSVIKDPLTSLEWVKSSMYPEQADPRLFQAIANDTRYAFEYARLSSYKNVPEVLIKSISTKKEYCVSWVKSSKFVPPLILHKINSDPQTKQWYQNFLKGFG